MDKKTKEAAKQEQKSRYQMLISGEAQPEGREKGYINLITGQTKYNLKNLPPEKAKEIRRKGAETVKKLHGEKKSAKQSLERILTLKIDDDILSAADLPPELAERLKKDNPDATIYDLIHMVAVGRAAGGSIPAMQYIRDTHGDAPRQQIELQADITTDQDRQLLQQISDRLQNMEVLEVIDNGKD